MMWLRIFLVGVVASTAACAAASGYDPARYSSTDASLPADPDTVALPPSPKTSIADPRLGAPPAPAPVDEDAGSDARPQVPLNVVMRGLETAMRKRDWPKILAALDDVAARGKDDKAWVGFAEKAGELAKKEEVGNVRKQCDGCHALRRRPRKAP